MASLCIISMLLIIPAFGSLGGLGRQDLSGYGFHDYLVEFGKVYGIADIEQREALFNASLQKVIAHNTEFQAGRVSWWLEMNRFADWSDGELKSLRSGRPVVKPSMTWKAGAAAGKNPTRVDWREKNVVTPVKDQHSCGSCWAFASAETLESHHAIAGGQLLVLSPQALVNCVQNPNKCGGSGGCHGAITELAFNLTATAGLPLESDVPYERRAMTCSPYKSVVKSTGYTKLPVNDALALETAVASIGPVAVIVAAMPWQLYGGGIFAGCSQPLPSLGNELDHAVQVVGYGIDEGLGYWLVRNSWGKWGEDGYIRVSRANDAKTFIDDDPGDGVACAPYPKTQTVGGECGILFDAAYPTGVHNVSSLDSEPANLRDSSIRNMDISHDLIV